MHTFKGTFRPRGVRFGARRLRHFTESLHHRMMVHVTNNMSRMCTKPTNRFNSSGMAWFVPAACAHLQLFLKKTILHDCSLRLDFRKRRARRAPCYPAQATAPPSGCLIRHCAAFGCPATQPASGSGCLLLCMRVLRSFDLARFSHRLNRTLGLWCSHAHIQHVHTHNCLLPIRLQASFSSNRLGFC